MLSGTSCALVPSGKAVWLRIEEWNMHWPKLHFSGFLSTMLLTFLSFSLFLMQQIPRAIVVKCDGSVYDVDVSQECTCMAGRARQLRLTDFSLMKSNKLSNDA